MHGAMKARRRVIGFAQMIDDLFDFLRALAIGDEHRVARIDDDEILHADNRHDALIGLNEAVGAFDDDSRAVHAIAGRIGFAAGRHFADRFPRADVAPVETRRHNRAPFGAFHQRVVDRDIRHRHERFARILDRAFPTRRAGMTCARGFKNIRTEFGRGGNQSVGTKTEHARIPRVVAGRDIALRCFAIGFFDEGGDVATIRQRVAHADIAESGFRRRRRNSECDQAPIRGQRLRFAHVVVEGRHVGDQMIGGQH